MQKNVLCHGLVYRIILTSQQELQETLERDVSRSVWTARMQSPHGQIQDSIQHLEIIHSQWMGWRTAPIRYMYGEKTGREIQGLQKERTFM